MNILRRSAFSNIPGLRCVRSECQHSVHCVEKFMLRGRSKSFFTSQGGCEEVGQSKSQGLLSRLVASGPQSSLNFADDEDLAENYCFQIFEFFNNICQYQHQGQYAASASFGS